MPKTGRGYFGTQTVFLFKKTQKFRLFLTRKTQMVAQSHVVTHGSKLGGYRAEDEKKKKKHRFHTQGPAQKRKKRSKGPQQKAPAPKHTAVAPTKPKARVKQVPAHLRDVRVTPEEAAALRARDAREQAELRQRYAGAEDGPESEAQLRERRERYVYKAPMEVSAADQSDYNRKMDQYSRDKANQTRDQKIYEKHGTRFDPLKEFKAPEVPAPPKRMARSPSRARFRDYDRMMTLKKDRPARPTRSLSPPRTRSVPRPARSVSPKRQRTPSPPRRSLTRSPSPEPEAREPLTVHQHVLRETVRSKFIMKPYEKPEDYVPMEERLKRKSKTAPKPEPKRVRYRSRSPETKRAAPETAEEQSKLREPSPVRARTPVPLMQATSARLMGDVVPAPLPRETKTYEKETRTYERIPTPSPVQRAPSPVTAPPVQRTPPADPVAPTIMANLQPREEIGHKRGYTPENVRRLTKRAKREAARQGKMAEDLAFREKHAEIIAREEQQKEELLEPVEEKAEEPEQPPKPEGRWDKPKQKLKLGKQKRDVELSTEPVDISGQKSKKRQRGLSVYEEAGLQEKRPPAEVQPAHQGLQKLKRQMGTSDIRLQMRERAKAQIPHAFGSGRQPAGHPRQFGTGLTAMTEPSQAERDAAFAATVVPIARAQAKTIALSGVAQSQDTSPNATETLLNEPDVRTQDPALGSSMPSGTGQEQQSNAVVNQPAVDQQLHQLEEQLSGGGEMGPQTLAGGEAFGFPAPPAPASMFGPSGGIEAIEEAAETIAQPTPQQAQPTPQAQPPVPMAVARPMALSPVMGAARPEPVDTAILAHARAAEGARLRAADAAEQSRKMAEARASSLQKHLEEERRQGQRQRVYEEQKHHGSGMQQARKTQQTLLGGGKKPKVSSRVTRSWEDRLLAEAERQERISDPKTTTKPKPLAKKVPKKLTTKEQIKERLKFQKERVGVDPRTVDLPPETKIPPKPPVPRERAHVPLIPKTKARLISKDKTKLEDDPRERVRRPERTEEKSEERVRVTSPVSRVRPNYIRDYGTDLIDNLHLENLNIDDGGRQHRRRRPDPPPPPPGSVHTQTHVGRGPETNIRGPETNVRGPETNIRGPETNVYGPEIQSGGGTGGTGTGTGGGGTGTGGSTGAININLRGGGLGGGGGAVAAASSSGAGASGAGQAAQAAGLIAALVKKPRKKQSGITAAKRRYTEVKLGELRALKSKRIREHATKTKKLKKADRDKQRREFKKRVNQQFKEVTKRFPTARGLRDLKTVRDLTAKLERVRMA